MPFYDTDLFEFLRDNAALNLIHGGRVYPLILPQNAETPALVYILIDGEPAVSQSGDSGYLEAEYQIDSIGDDYNVVKNLADALLTALSGYKGAFGSGTIGSAFIRFFPDIPDEETGRMKRPARVRLAP